MVGLIVSKTTLTIMAGNLQSVEGTGGIPWWAWLILIAILLILLLIGFVYQPAPSHSSPNSQEPVKAPAATVDDNDQDAAGVTVDQIAASSAGKPDQAVGQGEVLEPVPDDLKRIDGIGPKIASILIENGISTYAALAATDEVRLQGILDQAGIPFARPGPWPEQARLAANGQWSELESLQSNLKGGRRE